ATVLVDASGIKEGDFAGIAAFIGCYGAVALTKRNGVYEAVMFAKSPDERDALEVEHERIVLDGPTARLKCSVDYRDGKDMAEFFVEKDGGWVKIGVSHHVVFRLDHFCGCRFGLFYQSTEQTGGYADFMEFEYRKD
ncbi:MAG: acetyl xylan esterase, partial [Agathobacter sp.]|nr:acetyl xylan esterase [Agathobacter sp.]